MAATDIEAIQLAQIIVGLDGGKLLIDQHGEDAPIFAAMQADKRMEAGDIDGCAVWKRVLRAVQELLTEELPGDEVSVH